MLLKFMAMNKLFTCLTLLLNYCCSVPLIECRKLKLRGLHIISSQLKNKVSDIVIRNVYLLYNFKFIPSLYA